MAGQIPKEFIARLVQSADITEVVGSRIQLRKAGRSHKGLCPFHKEKTPSFLVSPERQMYHCFGCGAGGNVLGFLMEYEKLDFVTAVEKLAESLGMEVPRDGQNRQEDSDIAKIHKVLEEAAQFYWQQLRSSPFGKKAADYLKQRGLDGRTAKKFSISCAPDGWDMLLKALGREEAERIRLLEKAGLVIRREEKEEKVKVYDRLRSRIVFPIRDARGRVLGFGGRALPSGEEGQPKYINSPETPVFQKRRILYGLYEMQQTLRDERLPKPDSLLLVEGYMDVVMLAQHGIHNALAVLGTALGGEHLELAFRHAQTVTLCLDGDTAGYRAAESALKPALSAMRDGREVRFLFLPEGEDPDSLVRAKGKEHFQELLQRESRSLQAFLFEQLEKKADPQELEGKARLCQEAEPLLSLLPPEAGIYRRLLVEELAKRTGLQAEAVEMELEAMKKRRTRPANAGVPPAAFVPEMPPPPDSAPPEYSESPQDTGGTKSTKGEMPSLAERIIALFLCHSSPGRLPLDDLACPPETAGNGALNQLLSLLRDHPETSSGAILVYCEDNIPHPKILEHSSELAILQEDEHVEKELQGIREKLAWQAEESRIAEFTVGKDPSSWDDEDEEIFLQRLRKRHHRGAKEKKAEVLH